jgi:outer membrane receptor for ferrienterochelin and colicins
MRCPQAEDEVRNFSPLQSPQPVAISDIPNSMSRRPRMRHSLSLLALCLAALPLRAQEPEVPKTKGKYDMTYDELANLKISSASSLTSIERRKVPANSTLITADMIRHCGAHDLIELLNIYVPGFQIDRHPARYRIWGTRGINSPVKYTLLVNGRIMVDDWVHGTLPETLLPMLSDIESVEYINGPGSALHGGGAVGGVISVTTRNSTAMLDGKEESGRLRLSQGFINRGTVVEAEYARRLNEIMTLSLSYGANKYVGLSDSDTDYHGSKSYPAGSPPGFGGLTAGERWPANYAPGSRHDPYSDPLMHKFNLQFDAEDFHSWARYTKASVGTNDFSDVKVPNTTGAVYRGNLYEQFTWHNQWSQELTDELTLKLEAGYQHTLTAQRREVLKNTATDYHSASVKNDQLFSSASLTYDINEQHHLAFGGEVAWNRYDAFIDRARPDTHDRSTALFGEYQGELIEDNLTLILGGRADQNRYTEDSFAPRAALIWTPTQEDAFKLMYTKGFRDIQAEEWGRNLAALPLPDEYIENYEFSYSRQITDNWKGELGTYWSEAETIGLVRTNTLYGLLGFARSYGLYGSLEYHNDERDWRLGLSHNYDQVYDFESSSNVTSNNVYLTYPGESVKYWNWSPHSSKLYGWARFNEQLSLDGNLQINWLYEGLQKNYQHTTGGLDANFGPQINLNLGATWEFNLNHSLRLDVYNLMALIDRDLNRIHTYINQDYSTMPFSFALTYEFKF